MSALINSLAKHLLSLGDKLMDDSCVLTVKTGELIPVTIWCVDQRFIQEICSQSNRISHDCGMFIVEK